MKDKSKNILAGLLILGGIILLIYPTVSNFLYQRNATSIIQEYNYTVEDYTLDQISEAFDNAKQYNEKLTGNDITDPFADNDYSDDLTSYTQMLNVQGVMGYIDIPKINVYLPIYHGTSEKILKKGIGHMEMTSLPIGMVNNHTVLTGHRGLPSARLFTDLDQLLLGDKFYIHVLNEIFVYEVDQILVVEPKDIESLKPIENEDYVTLITCTPYGINSHRLLIRGTRVIDNIDDYVEKGGNIFISKMIIIIVAIIILILIIYLSKKRARLLNKKKSNKIRFVAYLCLLLGIGSILYPYVSQWVYTQKASNIINQYTKRLSNYSDEALEELYLKIVAYNKSLYENHQRDLVDPFSYEQIDFSLTEFGFDEDMIGNINIPRMDITLPIYLGASQSNLNKGAAHLTQTSIPVGGMNTNAVIAAHRGYASADMFRNIEKLVIGDKIIITNFKEVLLYEVIEIKIIQPTQIEEILIQEDRDLITLLTCHPYRINNQRYIVYAERVIE